MPSIIHGMGYQSTTAQLFTVPPNVAGFITVLVTAYFSDRTRLRGPFVLGGTVVGAVGYIMLLTSEKNAVKYAGTFFIAIGVFQCSPILMVRLFHFERPSRRTRIPVGRLGPPLTSNTQGWVSNNLAPHYVRATGVGVVISLANCSAFVGTFIYLQRDE